MKRVFLLLMLIGVIFLTSCGQKSGGQTEERETITVTVMTPIFSDDRFQDAVKQYYPEIQMEFFRYPEEQYYTVLKSRLATGKSADILDIQLGYAGPNGVEEIGPAGYLLPLYEVPEGYSEENEENLLISEGKVYGKALQRMSLGVVYNRELFEEYQLCYPECWEDFLECCETLKEHGIQPLTAGGRDVSGFQYALYQMAANQLYPEDPAFDRKLRSGEAKFTDEGTWDDLLGMYVSLFEKGYISREVLELKHQEAAEELFREKAAMMITTSLYYSSEVDTEEKKQKFFFAPLPANHRGQQMYVSESLVGGYGIYAGSTQGEYLKKALMDYNDNIEEDFYRKGAAFSEEKYRELPAFYFCNQGWPNEVEIVMENKLAAYLSGAVKSIEDITASMQKELEK